MGVCNTTNGRRYFGARQVICKFWIWCNSWLNIAGIDYFQKKKNNFKSSKMTGHTLEREKKREREREREKERERKRERERERELEIEKDIERVSEREREIMCL